MNTRVSELLDIKGHAVYTIGPDQTAWEAVREMDQHGIGSLLVVGNADEPPLGIVSEYDCRKLLLNEQDPRKILVSDMMSRNLVVVVPTSTVEDCMQLMTEKRVRHLPVIERNTVHGLLSIGDVVKFLYSDRERMVENLEKYITGSL